MILRRVFIHELPCMRLVLPALVCSVGSRVVAIDASLFGNRCSFMGSPIKPPSGYAFGQNTATNGATSSDMVRFRP